ncbi:MAG: lytic transglycosylase domain-containing protein [Clostridiales bacterium]|nr:lytic transglycosylase domain-containing protein [Clostridiales bacterium]
MKQIAIELATALIVTTLFSSTTSAETLRTSERIEIRLSDEAVEACEKYGEEYNICPELLMSIIETESGGNQYAQCDSCKGLMQVSTKWHADRMKRLGVTDIYDVDGNVHVGTDYLAELFEKYEDAPYVLDIYNGNSKADDYYEAGIISDYADEVLTRSEQLERLHGK